MANWFYKIAFLLLIAPTFIMALPANHDDFLRAESFLKKRQYTKFDHFFPNIKDHPLAPYLEAKRIKTQFYKKPIPQIDDFLKRYENQQPAITLKKQWVRYLAKKQEWSLFLDYYSHTPNLSLQCHQVTALESTKRQFDAINKGQEIWLYGVSLPRACDRLFKKWEHHGFLSQDLIWERLVTATTKRQYKLVRYLRKKLSPDYKSKAYVLRDLWRKPENLFNHKKNHLLPTDVQFVIFNKFVKKQPNILFEQTTQVENLLQQFDAHQIEILTKTSLHSLALQSGDQAYNWYEFAKKQKILNQELSEDFLQGAISTENWPLYTHLYKLAYIEIKEDPKWQYWQGRALTSMGAHTGLAHSYFSRASVHRDFYGFLASQKIGVSASMNHDPNHVPASKLQSVRFIPGIKRAIALYELNRIVQARREWQTVFSKQDTDTKEALAILAGRLEWSDRAIMSLAQIKQWHDLQLRFPLVHDEYFDKAAQQNKINKHWIYGIARQESAFMHDARSPVGATGLMQLMPSTAKSVSRRMRIKYSSRKLIDPSYNIKLGSHYLQYLLKRYDGNRVLATAAYNAGPGNVKRWLKRFRGDVDVWIEQIPYKETREYVQRVLTYSTIYSYRLGFLQPMLDEATLTAWAQLQPSELKISKANIKHNDKG